MSEHETTAPNPTQPQSSQPFRFYDNRQKYLAFVNTCNEKAVDRRDARRESSPVAEARAAGDSGSSMPGWATPPCSPA